MSQTAAAAANPSAASNSAPTHRPSKFRQFVVTALMVYPIITTLLYIILPYMIGRPIWQTTLLVVPLMVGMMSFLTPRVHARFSGFIMVPVAR